MLLLVSVSFSSFAEEQGFEDAFENLVKKSDRSYVSIGYALNEFRSIELVLSDNFRIDSMGDPIDTVRARQFPLTAQTYASSISFGTYLTDYFKTEVRYGMGTRDDSLLEALDIKINYWLNWYMGATYPVTDYMSAYALYGVSHYAADTTRREIEITITPPRSVPESVLVHPSRVEMEENLFGTSFSTSWLLGFDLGLGGPWYLAFEYGRLIRDTDTGIKVYQGGTYLRYEF